MTRIEDIPEIVTAMTSLRELSLTYNPLTTLNSSRVANLNQLTSIWFDGSSIPELPDEIWRLTKHLEEFAVQYTNITQYPSWVNEIAHPELLIDGFGSPLCDEANPSYAVGKLDHLSCEENLYGYN
ncbi:hypothetical protein Poli38472_000875 [Pythium oligandrum]|uniref:Uncharacterized protein n=1 Tax=Pythium oligandrum TaxID=41045 RepID=A0A8K1CDZ4_PYTOL|nr:hypothetical protein Poli38472_000875 [Pythium oligandrum]|eukprot:TMW60833.1 hypothetical protein Poli38472_000875 [Pythium oligandrum]